MTLITHLSLFKQQSYKKECQKFTKYIWVYIWVYMNIRDIFWNSIEPVIWKKCRKIYKYFFFFFIETAFDPRLTIFSFSSHLDLKVSLIYFSSLVLIGTMFLYCDQYLTHPVITLWDISKTHFSLKRYHRICLSFFFLSFRV